MNDGKSITQAILNSCFVGSIQLRASPPGACAACPAPGRRRPPCRRRTAAGRPAAASSRCADSACTGGGRNFSIGDVNLSASTLTQARPLRLELLDELAPVRRGSCARTSRPRPLALMPRTLPPAASASWKTRELRLRRQVAQVDDLQAVAQVRLVAAVLQHRVGVAAAAATAVGIVTPRHCWKTSAVSPSMTPKTSSMLDERHFHVELRELRLAVGAQVLVAQAAGDLEVLVVAGHHEQLLVKLRRLRQGVPLAGEDAARHEVVALEAVAAVLAAVAGLAVAAERGERVEGAAVDLDLAGAQPPGDARSRARGRPTRRRRRARRRCRWRSGPRPPRPRRAGSPAPGRRSPPGRSSSPARPRRRRWGGRSSRGRGPPAARRRRSPAARPRRSPSRCSRGRGRAGPPRPAARAGSRRRTGRRG